MKRKSQGVYTNEVIIQHHDSIVTALDLGLALNCQYDLSNRTILNDFDLVRNNFFGTRRDDAENFISVLHSTISLVLIVKERITN